MASSSAWFLRLDRAAELFAASGERELIYLIQFPKLFDVPGSPSWCRHVLNWQGRLLPAVNLEAWFNDRRSDGDYPVAAVVAYQQAPGSVPQYGALLLAEPPQLISVDDRQSCPLPDEWANVALACFEHDVVGQPLPVPILDLYRIFSGEQKGPRG